VNDVLRDWITQLAKETERRCDWLEFEEPGGGRHLVAGSLFCDEDGVAFDDDSGMRAAIPYAAIVAVRTGRQGEDTAGKRRRLPAIISRLAA
jgi:hypothetical protein